MELKLDTTFEVKYPTFLFAKFMWFILQIETNFDIMCRLDNLLVKCAHSYLYIGVSIKRLNCFLN